MLSAGKIGFTQLHHRLGWSNTTAARQKVEEQAHQGRRHREAARGAGTRTRYAHGYATEGASRVAAVGGAGQVSARSLHLPVNGLFPCPARPSSSPAGQAGRRPNRNGPFPNSARVAWRSLAQCIAGTGLAGSRRPRSIKPTETSHFFLHAILFGFGRKAVAARRLMQPPSSYCQPTP